MTVSPKEFPELMDTHQVAEYLRIKERKVYELLKEGRIPSARVTGKWLFPKSRIDAWVKESSGSPAEIRSRRATMVVAGSHDPLLDWALRRIEPGLAVLPGSSMDGIARLAAGEAAIVGVHLFDADSGEYNTPFVIRDLGSSDVVLLEWAQRAQGLVVASGNPHNLTSLADLARTGVPVVLRQEGSGSRVLFEWLLHQAGLTFADLNIIPFVARNENDVASTVAEGQAEAGLAVGSAAHGARLGFVPLYQERFDLLVERWAYFEPPFQSLLELARGSEFRQRAEAFGGYDISGFGTVHYNAP